MTHWPIFCITAGRIVSKSKALGANVAKLSTGWMLQTYHQSTGEKQHDMPYL